MSESPRRPGRLRRVLTWPVRVLVEPQSPATVVALVVLAVLGAGAWLSRDRWLPPAAPSNAPSATPTAGPSQDVVTPPPPSGSPTESAAPSDPFAGTPAATFPRGAAGIVMPEAQAVPGLTKSQVADGLALVRSALIAGRLDRRMLVSHDPSAFVVLLAPTRRAWASSAFSNKAFASMATWIDPVATLAPDEPRVKGSTTFRGGVDAQGGSYLEVVTNYVWVYPFAGKGAAGLTAIVHDDIRWQVRQGSSYVASDRGLWIAEFKAHLANVACAPARDGLIAPALSAASPSPGSAPSPVDPNSLYDPGRSLAVSDTCAP